MVPQSLRKPEPVRSSAQAHAVVPDMAYDQLVMRAPDGQEIPQGAHEEGRMSSSDRCSVVA